MQKIISLLCFLSLASSGLSTTDKGDIFAVLIAGSNEYWNYRHQADVAHAFHVLRDHGIKEANIITLSYNDVINASDNPFPGKLFNQPNGIDVAKNVKIDYQGKAVNPTNFMSILTGDAKNVEGGNGRVLKSTHADKVFVFFVDHGTIGAVAVIDDLLTAKQLNETLQTMYDKKMFKELVFYLESCESGSMFENILPSDVHILAITASKANEPSYGTYCDDPVMNTCLGDLFSVSWMENSDADDLNKETIESQYEIVKQKTNLSNVMKYGDLSITTEIVGHFQGIKVTPHSRLTPLSRKHLKPSTPVINWPSQEIPIRTLESQIKRATDPVKREKLTQQLENMRLKRAYHDMHTRNLVREILHDKPSTFQQLILSTSFETVRDLDCHHDVLTAYHKSCFNLGRNPYAMKISRILNNMCEHKIEAAKVVDTIQKYCRSNTNQIDNIH